MLEKGTIGVLRPKNAILAKTPKKWPFLMIFKNAKKKIYVFTFFLSSNFHDVFLTLFSQKNPLPIVPRFPDFKNVRKWPFLGVFCVQKMHFFCTPHFSDPKNGHFLPIFPHPFLQKCPFLKFFVLKKNAKKGTIQILSFLLLKKHPFLHQKNTLFYKKMHVFVSPTPFFKKKNAFFSLVSKSTFPIVPRQKMPFLALFWAFLASKMAKKNIKFFFFSQKMTF